MSKSGSMCLPNQEGKNQRRETLLAQARVSIRDPTTGNIARNGSPEEVLKDNGNGCTNCSHIPDMNCRRPRELEIRDLLEHPSYKHPINQWSRDDDDDEVDDSFLLKYITYLYKLRIYNH